VVHFDLSRSLPGFMMPDSTRPTGTLDGQAPKIMLSPTNPEIGTNLCMRVISPWIAS
jgi:hypothetical protein